MLSAIPSRFLDPHQQQQQQPQQQQPQQPPQNQLLQQQPQQQQPQQQQPPQGPSQLPIPPAPPQPNHTPPADLTLAGVLHFLQSEWRRYERDRNEWEIERAELRARVALLEGERRSFDNVKLDLVRRIKMLEFALKSERTKLVHPPALPGTKIAHLRTSDQATDSASSTSDLAPASPPGSPPPLSEPLALDAAAAAASLPNGDPGSASAPTVSSSPPKPTDPPPAPPTKPLPPPKPPSLSLHLSAPPPGKDPKSRARSREYLKLCLQEVSYLTSSAALNPLPNRALVPPAIPPSLAGAPPADPALGRPRKSLVGPGQPPAIPPPQQQVHLPPARTASPPRLPSLPNGLLVPPAMPGEATPLAPSPSDPLSLVPTDPSPDAAADETLSTSESGELIQSSTVPAPSEGEIAPTPAPAVAAPPEEPVPSEPPSESPPTDTEPPVSPSGMHPLASWAEERRDEPGPPHGDGEDKAEEKAEQQQVPEEGEWAERMREARERMERAEREAGLEEARAEAAGLSAEVSGEEEPDTEEEEAEEEEREQEQEQEFVGAAVEEVGVETETGVEEEGVEGETKKVWLARRTLKSHLDAVRAVSWHPRDSALATGGDDCTVKLWRLDSASLTNPHARQTADPEPVLTYRGHSAPITALAHSPLSLSLPTPSHHGHPTQQKLLFSASLDATIRIWGVPDKAHSGGPYAPFDAKYTHRATLVGHAEAVWALGVVPLPSAAQGSAGMLLASAGADGSVKMWDVEGRGELRSTWGYDGTGVEGETPKRAATSVEPVRTEVNRIAVGWDDAVVKLYDVESGREVVRLKSDVTYDGTPQTQVNRVISHPTMPLLVTAHEDKYIRIFDLKSGQCTHSQLAHLDGVTSLSFDAQGFLLATASHDCSVRLWDLFRGGVTCVQELQTGHRAKANEGALDVQFHPTMQLLASAGADGTVKVFANS